MAVSSNQNPWRRKHDDPTKPARVPLPQERFYPGSLDDVISVIQTAESLPLPKPQVRASGSHWALSDAAVTEDFIVETSDPDDPSQPSLDGLPLYDVIPHCMTPSAVRWFADQAMPGNDPTQLPLSNNPFYLYHVLAGTRIYQLYCLLDHGENPNDPRTLSHVVRTRFGPQPNHDYTGPWAMATLGGAGGQTIVGAFSTGTHGGDVGLPPIADFVQAIHLVGPQGTLPHAPQYWLERPLEGPGLPTVTNVVDDALLAARHPGIKVIRDPDVFNSVIVGAGRFGIIYSVVLRVVRQYALLATSSKDVWSSVMGWISNPSSPNFAHRFVQVVVNPYPQASGNDHSCYIANHDTATLASATPHPPNPPYLGQKERCGPNAGHSHPLGASEFFSNICSSSSPLQAGIDSAINPLAAALLPLGVACFWGVPLACTTLVADIVAIAALEALKSQLPTGPASFGEALTSFVDWCVNNGSLGYDLLRFVSDFLLGDQLLTSSKTAVSYAILDAHDYLDQGCTNVGDSLEVFFDASSPVLVSYVNNVIQRVQDLRQGLLTGGTPAGFTGYVSLRFMQNTAALIGMQQWPATCSMEIAGLLGALGTEQLLAALEKDAIAAGAAVHWGQRNNLAKPQVEMVFSPIGPGGVLFRWRNALGTLSQNGSANIFSTPFTFQRGLEVVQPLVGAFSVTPSRSCAGSQVQINWTADQNPPGSLATLVISPPNTTLALGSLTGSQPVTLGEGPATFQFVVTYTYPVDGSVKQDSRTVQVQGFQTGDVWTITQQATCQGGHWAGSLSLSPNDVSANLLATNLKVVFSNVPPGSQWTVSGPGFAGVVLSQAQPTHVFAAPPTLQGNWNFVLNAAGCVAPTPNVDIEFTIKC